MFSKTKDRIEVHQEAAEPGSFVYKHTEGTADVLTPNNRQVPSGYRAARQNTDLTWALSLQVRSLLN